MSELLNVTSPYDNHFIKELPLISATRAEQLLSRTGRLFKDRAKWLPKYRRIKILENLARLMEDRVEELTRTAAEEGGKPYQDSKVEVLRAINGVRIAIAGMYNLKGEEIPMGLTAPSGNRLSFTTIEPIGVVLAISAFNHPVNLIIHQVIPAIATGCPVIVKPASATPLSCLRIVELLYQAGLPEEYCTPVICDRRIAENMVMHPAIGYMTFIGSAEVGWKLRSLLAPGTRVALEHGGVAPVIIGKDADIGSLMPDILKAGFYHAGQVCVSTQRIFVHDSLARTFAKSLAGMANQLVIGDPLSPETQVGPLILPTEVNRIDEWVGEARQNGGEILSGGSRISESLYAPTVIWDPPDNVKVSACEVFGPVICIYPYKKKEDAISRANSLRYAFQAAVYSNDINFALEVSQKLNASAVMINDHTAFRVDWMPFGGRDESGIGTGGIPYTMKEMTRQKLLVFKSRDIQ
jgi:acyl-CoA reductase-like NAD-dependent aldehyde dehydrogenase